MRCRSSTSRPPQPPLKLGTQSRHYLTVSATAVEASRTGTNRLERVEWLWILYFLMIKFLRYCRPGVEDPFVICKSESSRTQQKHLHCTIERCGCQKACIFTIIQFFFMSGCFDACLCVLCLLLLLLLTILFYRKSASFFDLFVLVARGRIINPFNEIRIRRKTAKKESCAAGLRMKTKGKETHGRKRASSNTHPDSTLDARYMSKKPPNAPRKHLPIKALDVVRQWIPQSNRARSIPHDKVLG